MPVLRWSYTDDECTHECELPACYAVCPDCGGEGKTLAHSLRGAFTESEFAECFDTEESREEYRRGGAGIYGVTCGTCNGRTTVLVPDEARCDAAELARYRAHMERRARDAAQWQREQEMGW